MSVDIICPECGGVIGATDIDAQGRGPCTCYKPPRDEANDTVSIPSAPQEPAPVTETPKLCIVCGKNVSGHRRVKDSRGYLCYGCAKSEIKQEREGTVPCTECGKRIKEAGLINYNGIMICRKCYDDHKEAEKKVVRKVATAEYKAQDKKTVIILGIIFVILGLILLIHQFTK